MIELHNSSIYWSWSLFLSLSFLFKGFLRNCFFINFFPRIWWIIFTNSFVLTISYIINLSSSYKEGSYFDGVLNGFAIGITPLFCIFIIYITRKYLSSYEIHITKLHE